MGKLNQAYQDYLEGKRRNLYGELVPGLITEKEEKLEENLLEIPITDNQEPKEVVNVVPEKEKEQTDITKEKKLAN